MGLVANALAKGALDQMLRPAFLDDITALIQDTTFDGHDAPARSVRRALVRDSRDHVHRVPDLDGTAELPAQLRHGPLDQLRRDTRNQPLLYRQYEKAVRDALGLTKGTTLKVEIDGGRIILRKDASDALSKVRGKFKLAEGFKSTDEAMRAIRGRAPGDPYPAPLDEE